MRDSQLYIPSSLRHKLSLIARKRNLDQSAETGEGAGWTTDSIGTELLEWAIAQKYPEFAAAYAEREDWDKKLMETIK